MRPGAALFTWGHSQRDVGLSGARVFKTSDFFQNILLYYRVRNIREAKKKEERKENTPKCRVVGTRGPRGGNGQYV